ncbi:8100_t:CDS:2 [Scutellospora calospora]|uniref:8100_t:CDS:1 n=1 Tax=Scutellospora calospora TaxID=85575 RepID=A0ACA9KQ56_9GLOM|nr:8100_t:CDS:2 [Scutellospora calospora]
MNYNKRQIIKEPNSRELDKKKSRNLEPSSAWLKEWEWLEYCEIDETLLMFYQKHQKAKQQFTPILPNQLFENDRKIIQQIKCVYFAAKKHLLFNVYPDLCSLISSNNIFLTSQPLKFPSQELVEVKNYSSYLNSVATQNFAEAIVHVIETSLINEIKLSVN